MKGKITISRCHSNDPEHNNAICIHLENGDYDRLIDIEMKPEEFTLALTGLACVECEFRDFRKVGSVDG